MKIDNYNNAKRSTINEKKCLETQDSRAEVYWWGWVLTISIILMCELHYWAIWYYLNWRCVNSYLMALNELQFKYMTALKYIGCCSLSGPLEDTVCILSASLCSYLGNCSSKFMCIFPGILIANQQGHVVKKRVTLSSVQSPPNPATDAGCLEAMSSYLFLLVIMSLMATETTLALNTA